MIRVKREKIEIRPRTDLMQTPVAVIGTQTRHVAFCLFRKSLPLGDPAIRDGLVLPSATPATRNQVMKLWNGSLRSSRTTEHRGHCSAKLGYQFR